MKKGDIFALYLRGHIDSALTDYFSMRNLRCRIFQMTVKGFSRQVMGEDILVEEKNGYNEELLVMVINKSVFRVNLSLL